MALVKTELELCVGRPALQGLTGIGIPSRKTQARHSGQLCSIRGKSGGDRSGAEPYRRVEQTAGQSAVKPGVDRRRFRNPYSSRVPGSGRVLALRFSRTLGRILP